MAINPEELEQFFDAVEGGDMDVVARRLDAEPQLMEAQHPPNPPRRFRPLGMAARMGHTGVVRMLLERGAEVNASTASSGFTALHHAAATGHEEVVAVLLSNGADSSRKPGMRCTALTLASSKGHLGVARQLLQHMQGRGLDERSYLGYTAFWYTCHLGHVEIARSLLLAGADHTIAIDDGRTPRQAAERSGRTECVALLEWWEGELERGYVVHRARYLAEQHSLLQPTLDAAAASVASSLASSLASVSIPAFLSPRTRFVPAVPHVEVVRLSGEEETGASTGQGKRKVEEEGGGDVQGPSEAERDATVKYVMQDLHPELYIELMAGFHPLRVPQEEA